MKIAMLAPPWIEIPPPGYGGIEQVSRCWRRSSPSAGTT